MMGRVVLGIVTVLAAGVAAFAEEKSRNLSAADHAEIQQLYIQYARSIDTYEDQGYAYARVFAADGELYHHHSGKTYKGHDAIAKDSIGSITKPSPWPTHYNTNLLIEPSPEGARGRVYLLVMRGSAEGRPSVSSIGTYRDTLVKTKDGWRFKRRELYLNAMPPADDAAAAKK